MPDTLGYRKKIALIVPAVNATVQPECDAMRPAGVTNHTGRIDTPNANVASDAAFLKHVEGMRAGIDRALDQIASLAPDVALRAAPPAPRAPPRRRSSAAHRASGAGG